jgi:hypothetical protein
MTELYERSGVSLTVPYYFNNDEDSIAYFWGRWWTPFPMKKKLLTVVGKPLHVVQKNEPTDEDIALLRNRYIEAVTELFHKWKAKYSLLWRDRNLVIS